MSNAVAVEQPLQVLDGDEDGDEKWFDNTVDDAESNVKKGVVYADDTDESGDDDDAFSDDDSLFFSDEEEMTDPEKDKTFILSGPNKTCQLGAEVAQAKQQLNSVYTKLEEGQKAVDDGREEVEECRNRQQALKKDLAVTEGEIAASKGNIPSVQRLTNLKNRLEKELEAEVELEASLEEFVKSQELTLNQAVHERGQYQHLELMLREKEQTLGHVKDTLTKERKTREKKILMNAERDAINKELKESLINIEHEDRTKAAIAAARKAQKEGRKYLKETWKKVKARERAEQDQLREEGERRVRMLLQYKENLHKTQNKLKKNSQRKARLEKEQEVIKMTISPEERFQNAQKQKDDQMRAQFENTQRDAKSALISKILTEDQSIEKRRAQQPQLFNDRLTGRHNKPTPQTYSHIINMAKSREAKVERKVEAPVEMTVGYSSSEDEMGETGGHVTQTVVTRTDEGEDDSVLVEPEFRGLWEAPQAKKPTAPSKFSRLEQKKMQEVLEKQRENIVQKQITVQREFVGQAFMSKPEEVVFSDYVVGESYSQNLTLTNVSYTINTLKLIGLSNNLLDFITVDFTPPGHLSAGLTCDLKVSFTPLINKDITGEIKMLAQTGAFSIPVKCRIKRTEISVPNTAIDFGTVCVGEHQKAYINIVNDGALGTNFKVRPLGWVGELEGNISAAAPLDEGLEGSALPREPSKMIQDKLELDKLDTTDTICEKDEASVVTFETFKETETLPATPSSPKLDREASIRTVTVLDEPGNEEEMEVVPAPPSEPAPDIILNKNTTRGFIEPNSSVQVEVQYNPHQVGEHVKYFEVLVEDGSIEPVTVTVKANTIDLPVYVEEQDIYLKYCMVDRLYQDSVVLHNRASSALRIKFEIPKALKDHVDVLPQVGVVQACSSFSAQLKFIPLPSIFEDCKKFFCDGQLLKIPIRVKVADQTRCVPFTVSAHVTGTDLSFSAKELDFGCCSIYESVRMPFSLTNHCLLPQLFGFVSVPDFVTIQPNDGFGTLLPGETLELEAVVHAKVLGEHSFSITCTTEIDRNFSLKCRATGVIPHLEVSHPLIRFAPTALGDVRQASFYISNNPTKTEDGRKAASTKNSFHIVVPEGVDLKVSPCVGTLAPGQRLRIQLTFGPTLKKDEIEAEAMEAAKNEILAEIERKKKAESEVEKPPDSVQGGKKSKAKKGSSKPITPKSPQDAPTPNPLENIAVTEKGRTAAMIRLKTNFKERFEKLLIPCFTAVGECRHDRVLDYRHCDTVYLQVHMPAVKPELVLLSQNGSSVVDFGNVCIGQTKKMELTLKSIADERVSLTTSPFPHDGTFQKMNATRDLDPHGLHQMLLDFTPKTKSKFYEVVEVRTQKSTLHLHLHGTGVEPHLEVSPDSGELDLGHVMVGEILSGNFKLTNRSEIDLQYSVSLLSEQVGVVQDITGDSDIGNSNKSGILPFKCTPHSGSIEKGKSQDVTVHFNPDHQDSYKDVIIVKLLNQPQEHRIRVQARSWTGSMYLVGGKMPTPSVTLHALTPHIETPLVEPETEEIAGQVWVLFVCSLSANKQVFTQTFDIGNCRGAGYKPDAANSKDAKGAKPSGDFAFDPLKADLGPLVKALVINPQKGSVESCSTVPIQFQFTPPKEMSEVGSRLEFNTMLSLKGETIEQFRVNFVVEIVK